MKRDGLRDTEAILQSFQLSWHRFLSQPVTFKLRGWGHISGLSCCMADARHYRLITLTFSSTRGIWTGLNGACPCFQATRTTLFPGAPFTIASWATAELHVPQFCSNAFDTLSQKSREFCVPLPLPTRVACIRQRRRHEYQHQHFEVSPLLVVPLLW